MLGFIGFVDGICVGGAVNDGGTEKAGLQAPIHWKLFAFDASIVASVQVLSPSQLTIHDPIPH